MSRHAFAAPAVALAALLSLTGCETLTGSIGEPAVAHTIGTEDDVTLGKKQFRLQNYGLAESHFRTAVERMPGNLEAWLGLAAAYDQLRRFDLADRAYQSAARIGGQTPEFLNNRGYSYLLRGDVGKARRDLNAARAKDPANPSIQQNLRLLDNQLQSQRRP